MTDATHDPAADVASAYRRWLTAQPSGADHYLLAEPRVRFEPRGTDVLVRVPGSPVPSYPDAELERDVLVLEMLDATRTWDEACRLASVTPSDAEPLLRAGFGTVLLAPLAVAELEARLPCAEIVRFPGSPYEVVRNYWANMAAVREQLDVLFRRTRSPEPFMAELERLHRLLLVGPDGTSFYRPASPISSKGVDPGVLWDTASRLEEEAGGPRLVEGPRVSAAEVGGKTYWALLAESVRDLDALSPVRTLVTADGRGWGQVLTARAGADLEQKPWFIPPRPLHVALFAGLCESFVEARDAVRRGERKRALAALARFHQRFVRLHPFRAGNQSLVMNIVNALLRELAGAGIPHLILDQLALRFDEAAYVRLFARAVDAWTAVGSPLARYRALTERKARYFSLLAAVDGCENLDAARALANERPEDAALALLRA
jgi:hypothetical protein